MKLLQKGVNLLKKPLCWCKGHKFLTVVIVLGVVCAASFITLRNKLFNPIDALKYE